MAEAEGLENAKLTGMSYDEETTWPDQELNRRIGCCDLDLMRDVIYPRRS